MQRVGLNLSGTLLLVAVAVMQCAEGRVRHLDLLRRVRVTAADSMPPQVAAAMEHAAKVRAVAQLFSQTTCTLS